jgi:translation initiation factor IF-3
MSEVTGIVKVLNVEQVISASFKKRELVVTTDEQYPQHIMVEFNQDKCDLLNSYKVGDSVKVSINLRGREWVSPQGETKYFNGIQGWRIEKLAAEEAPEAPRAKAEEPSDLHF